MGKSFENFSPSNLCPGATDRNERQSQSMIGRKIEIRRLLPSEQSNYASIPWLDSRLDAISTDEEY
jgi:hypothetical protein